MKTIGEIIESAKNGERPEYDDLRLAVCALDYLMTFDRNAIWKLAEAEAEGKKPFLVSSALWQRDENFSRIKRAMGKTPKEYLGTTYNPDDPEVQTRRKAAIALWDRALAKASANPT